MREVRWYVPSLLRMNPPSLAKGVGEGLPGECKVGIAFFKRRCLTAVYPITYIIIHRPVGRFVYSCKIGWPPMMLVITGSRLNL